jgi:ADP-L-glycero-D-manno-heptose 6-epimerase
MIVITGAAGFIGSCVVGKLNSEGHTDLILVDDFSKIEKDSNLIGKQYIKKFDRKHFLSISPKYGIDFFIHIGARTDTTETNKEIFDELNLNYSKSIWYHCVKNNIPLIYISSAATYGDGKLGYNDQDDSLSYKLKPLNFYGESKNDFDKWVLEQTETPPNWYGLKLFNVFGPNEYHKGRMASVVYHAYKQAKETNKIKLFKSHNPNFGNGEQLRDFIYVKDVIDVIFWLTENTPKSGIYNVGSGRARSFSSLVDAVCSTIDSDDKIEIEFIDMPEDIKDKYQYFTQANINKLRSVGYTKPFFSLEEAIDDYIQNYLNKL